MLRAAIDRQYSLDAIGTILDAFLRVGDMKKVVSKDSDESTSFQYSGSMFAYCIRSLPWVTNSSDLRSATFLVLYHTIHLEGQRPMNSTLHVTCAIIEKLFF